MSTIYGLGIMIALFLGAALLIFGVPKLLKYVADTNFKLRKKNFETNNPKYELVRGGVLGLPSVFPVKRTFYTVTSIENKKHYVEIYKDRLHFYVTNNCIPRRRSMNAEDLYKSLKAWKAWNPEGNYLAVEYKKSENSTFRLSTEVRTDPQLNEFLIEVLEADFLEALEKTIAL